MPSDLTIRVVEIAAFAVLTIVIAVVGWYVRGVGQTLRQIADSLSDHEIRLATVEQATKARERECEERLHWLREMTNTLNDTARNVAVLKDRSDRQEQKQEKER